MKLTGERNEMLNALFQLLKDKTLTEGGFREARDKLFKLEEKARNVATKRKAAEKAKEKEIAAAQLVKAKAALEARLEARREKELARKAASSAQATVVFSVYAPTNYFADNKPARIAHYLLDDSSRVHQCKKSNVSEVFPLKLARLMKTGIFALSDDPKIKRTGTPLFNRNLLIRLEEESNNKGLIGKNHIDGSKVGGWSRWVSGYTDPFASGGASFVEIESITPFSQPKPFKRGEVIHLDSVQQHAIRNEYVNVTTSCSGVPETWIKMPSIRIENGCGYEIIQQQFHKTFEANRRYYKFDVMDLKSIWNVVRPEDEYDPADLGLTLPQFMRFFMRFELALVVMDQNNRILTEYCYEPTKENKKLSPFRTFVISHNNHLYLCNDNLRSFQQKLDAMIEKQKDAERVAASPYYFLRDTKGQKFLWLNNINDLYALDVKNCEQLVTSDEHPSTLLIYCETDLMNLTSTLISKAKYEPNVKMVNGIIKAVYLKIDGVDVTICKPCDFDGEPDQHIGHQSLFEKYNEWNNKLYDALLNVNTKSTYSASVAEALDLYHRRPLKGYISSYKGPVYAGDFCKAYTACLMGLEYLPAVNVFDEFKFYDQSPIKPENSYIVRAPKNIDRRAFLLFDAERVWMNGSDLIEVMEEIDLDGHIEAMLEPSRKVSNIARSVIVGLWMSDLPEQHKKNIVNINIGMAGKKVNTKEKAFVFQDELEAYAFAQANKQKRVFWPITKDDVRVCLVNESVGEAKLCDGFRLIQQAIYSRMRVKLWKEAKDKEVVAINTDCIYVKPFDGLVETAKPHSLESIGQIWWSKVERPTFGRIKFEEKPKLRLPVHHVDNHTLNNEWVADEYVELVENNDRLFIGANVPGAGKSHGGLSALKGKRVLCVSPYNKQKNALAKQSGHKAVTACKLLGMVPGQKDRGFLNVDEFDYIFIDEVACLTVPQLAKLKKFMEKNPIKKYIATGDVNQTRPIEDYPITCGSPQAYYQMIINMLFPVQIGLEVPKRYKTAEQNKDVLVMKQDIFSGMKAIPFLQKWDKYFSPISRIEKIDGLCIAYTNKTAEVVDRYLHNINKPVKTHDGYYEGMRLLCKKPLRIGSERLVHNSEYVVKKVGKDFIITDDDNDEPKDWTVSATLIKRHFTFCYAHTCHSLQGETVDGAITIFDVDHWAIDKNWLWTAISRPRDLSLVQYYAGNLDTACSKMSMFNKAEARIHSHKLADKKAKRDYDEDDYITAQDVMDMYKHMNRCGCCGESLGDDFSIDRIDNKLAHVKGNCRLRCLSCNLAHY